MIDSMAYDGLFCAFDQLAMGLSTEEYNARYDLTREEQDEFSARSHQLAARAAEGRRCSTTRSSPVAIPQRKGDPIVFSADEGVRADTTVESLARLRPAFAKDGTITAGSASQISDGAAAVVVMSKAKAEELGLTWLAEIGAHGVVAGPDASLQEQPANAMLKALREGGHRRRRPRPVRAQRGVRRGGHRLDARSSASPRRRSTSTAARSPWATRSACPAPASCCTWRSS